MSGVSVEAPSGKGKGDENFPVGSRLIRPALRPHVHAFYGFARNADDIADSPVLSPADKLSRLDTMGAVLTGDAEAGSDSALRLRDSLEETRVTPQHSLDLLHAFRQDATKTRYADWGELLDYCRYSAAPVGRHVLDLHGERGDTYPASDALCASLQVLNHLQDCARDLAELDRCYLPQDLLAQAGVATDTLRGPHAVPGLRRVLDQLLDATDALNRSGAALPGVVRDRRLRVETAVIAGLAKRLARRLRREDPLAARVKLRRGDVVASVLTALPRLR
jgi:farnesyl-diphosphate farnesyltransferase